MIRKRNLAPELIQWIQAQAGLGPMIGDVKFLVRDASSTQQFRTKLQEQGVSDGDMFTTLVAAEAAMTSYRNDVLVALPGWFSTEVTTDWNLYDSHFLGTSMTPFQSRTDIVHETNAFSPFMTISGRGNSFSNLTIRHGTAEADYIGLLISGRYNSFNNLYMMSPMVQAQADHADYVGVHITGHANYFKNCLFGSQGTHRAGANYNIRLSGIGNVFEDCLIVAAIDDTDPQFLWVNNVVRDMRYNIFRRCSFIAYSAGLLAGGGSKMDDAIHCDVGGNTSMVLLEDCNFYNVDQISTTSSDDQIWKSAPYIAPTSATFIAIRALGA